MQEENKHSCTIENNKRASLYRCDKRLLSRESIYLKPEEWEWDSQAKSLGKSFQSREIISSKKREAGKRLACPNTWYKVSVIAVNMGEGDLETYQPAISTINTINNEAAISFKFLGFIKNQNMFAEWNLIKWYFL